MQFGLNVALKGYITNLFILCIVLLPEAKKTTKSEFNLFLLYIHKMDSTNFRFLK